MYSWVEQDKGMIRANDESFPIVRIRGHIKLCWDLKDMGIIRENHSLWCEFVVIYVWVYKIWE